MAAKQRRRKHSRKEQSNRDKARTLMADTTYAEPLREYNHFLDHLKSNGYAHDEFTRIPLNLIDLAAAVIASMITGRELALFGGRMHSQRDQHGPHQQQPFPSSGTLSPDDGTDVFYFIQRILKRTQLSCTTLILALIYIDRFKARSSWSLRRRTRLDQGPDYHQAHNSDPSYVAALIPGNLDSSTPHSPNSSGSTSSAQTPSPTNTDGTHRSSNTTGSGNISDNSSKRPREPWSSISLFLVAVICADKYLFDATFSNAEWAEFARGQYTIHELNDLERRFLGHLQYKLYVSEPEFDGFLSYLEVIMALKQVWGRGLITFSYSDVRILTQRLMPAYAGRLHFKMLQDDMMAIVWQVMAAFSRVYLTVMGTIILAVAGYTAVNELSHILKHNAASPSLSHAVGQPYGASLSSLSSLPPPPINTMTLQPRRCNNDLGYLTSVMEPSSESGARDRQVYDEAIPHSFTDWALAQSPVVQCVA
ncbi:Cyclin-dependent protein kinase [Dissophora globulifera]|uniref:Cyclin-dependent protein kinase n=1 Tax=Dissophora globulifera TaxID=979702 RepID=A0A9P6V0U4_9FUNG|nr:Cyclin-dependent protein kinase [Dissophora globulifera]